MERQVVLDTETTGLNPLDGHRIIEIGCIELINRKPTKRKFHTYIHPEREIDIGASQISGITLEKLLDKPKFHQIADDFLAFIEGAEVIIHNAPFDIGFINHELNLLKHPWGKVNSYIRIFDTLALARQMHPGQRNSLDALCKRYGVDNSHRALHGALLDAEILAKVYLLMTAGQGHIEWGGETESKIQIKQAVNTEDFKREAGVKLTVIYATEAENRAHEARMAGLLQKIEEAN